MYGLNPLFIRSFYQTARMFLKRQRKEVLIPYSSGHFIKLSPIIRLGCIVGS